MAISYLMMKDKLSYEAAAGHVKALRPVVSLNAGFETQLKCLERANCHVFDAHQLHLQSKLTALGQHRLDGSLEMTLQKKRRQNHHHHHHHQQQQHSTIPRTPPHPSPSIRAQQQQRENQAAMACCDDRGMLDGNLPSGFCLSLPFTSKKTQFIPALRSMGSRFGCKSCGEHLFCASAVVQHSPKSNFSQLSRAELLALSISPGRREKQDDALSFDGDDIMTTPDVEIAVRIKPVAAEIETSQPPPAPKEVEAKKKKPLLAKLRLRPQSPSVSSPTGSAKSTPRANGPAATASVDLPVAASDSVGAADSVSRADDDTVDVRGGVLKTLKKEKPKQHDTKDECGLKHSITSSGAMSTHTSTSINKGADKLWRTLTAFTASKRMFKDKKLKQQHLHTDLAAIDDKKRVKDANTEGGEHETFLQENAANWERSLRLIEKASDEDNEESTDTRAQVTALVAADVKAMAMLDCTEWFIEPQAWFMDSMSKSHSGAIRCPNGDCNATVGQWRWDGLRYEHWNWSLVGGWTVELMKLTDSVIGYLCLL